MKYKTHTNQLSPSSKLSIQTSDALTKMGIENSIAFAEEESAIRKAKAVRLVQNQCAVGAQKPILEFNDDDFPAP